MMAPPYLTYRRSREEAFENLCKDWAILVMCRAALAVIGLDEWFWFLATPVVLYAVSDFLIELYVRWDGVYHVDEGCRPLS
jgi:hypothetical protein